MTTKFRVYTKEFIDNLTKKFVNYNKNVAEIPEYEGKYSCKFYAPFVLSTDNYSELYRMPADKWIRMEKDSSSNRLTYYLDANNIVMPNLHYNYLINLQIGPSTYQFHGVKQQNIESNSNLCWMGITTLIHFRLSSNGYGGFFKTQNLQNPLQLALGTNPKIEIYYQNFGDEF